MKRPASSLAIASCVVLFGCGSEDQGQDAPAEEDPGEHACEVFGDEGTRVTASEVAEDSPELESGEQPYSIELVDGAAGFVKLHGGGDALLFVEEENVVTGLFAEDALDTDLLPSGAPNEFCESDVKEHFDLELEGAGYYYLQLGPSALDSVWVVFIGAEGHAHED